jgi:hypothetical protein
MLAEGSLSLATARLLASHLTTENLPRLLDAAKGKSKRQVEVMLAGFFPKPDVPSSIRKLPAPVPPVVRRVVWGRDGGACSFVGKSGRRCNETAFVEFHHVDPHGVGGEPSIENIQLLCRTHNAFEGELFYGHGRPTERRTLPGKG